MSLSTIVVVGGGLAGLRAVESARRLGHEGPLVLVSQEDHLPYDRPPLSKGVLADETITEPPCLQGEEWFVGLGIDIRLGSRATGLDAVTRSVITTAGSIRYDRLVIATGVRPRTPSQLGHGILTLRNWEDALKIRERLARALHVTVLGAGVLGAEVASSARNRGLPVTLIERQANPMPAVLGPELGASFSALYRRCGVDLRLETSVESVSGSGRHLIELGDRSVVETDLVVAAVGSLPNTEWLQGSGVALDDGVVCNRFGETTIPGIFAIGDVARMTSAEGVPLARFEHWTRASDSGAGVMSNVLAKPDDCQPVQDLPYFWSDQFGLRFQALGSSQLDDNTHVVAGALDDKWLAVSSRDGAVTGLCAWGMPRPLNRCRLAVVQQWKLTQFLDAAPWKQ